jgi:hypothetical protein
VVEHLLAKEKVAGSIPVSRSRFAYIRGEHKHTFGREFVSLVGKCNMQPALHRSQFVAGYLRLKMLTTVGSFLWWSMGGSCLSVLSRMFLLLRAVCSLQST